MEFDGYTNFQLTLKADQATDVRDCRLEIPLKSRFAKYMMGMGRKGGTRPESFQWTWDPARHQDCLWLGNVDGGTPVQAQRAELPLAPGQHPLPPPPAAHARGVAQPGKGRLHGDRGRRPRRVPRLRRPESDGGGRRTSLRFRPAHYAREATRPEDPLDAPLLPWRRALAQGSGRTGGPHHQHPPRQRSQPLHQLPVPHGGQASTLHRRGTRVGAEGQALLHDPRTDEPRGRVVGVAEPRTPRSSPTAPAAATRGSTNTS